MYRVNSRRYTYTTKFQDLPMMAGRSRNTRENEELLCGEGQEDYLQGLNKLKFHEDLKNSHHL